MSTQGSESGQQASWFEVRCVLKVQAADEDDAISRAAGALRGGYKEAAGVYPVGSFDARPCASPLMKQRNLA